MTTIATSSAQATAARPMFQYFEPPERFAGTTGRMVWVAEGLVATAAGLAAPELTAHWPVDPARLPGEATPISGRASSSLACLRNADAIAWQSWKRCSLSFLSARTIMASTPVGRDGLITQGATGSSFTTLPSTVATSPLNGFLPVNNS